MLDGKHNGEITAAYFAPKILSSANTLDNISDGVWFYANGNNPTNSVGNNSALLQIGSRWWDRFQLAFPGNNSNSLHFRSSAYESESSLNWNSWKTIAFTDSNVESATKLQTARTIWGQNFDGTGNISGNLTNANDITFGGYLYSNRSGVARTIIDYNSGGVPIFGGGTAGAGIDTYLDGNNIYLRTSTGHTNNMMLTSSGNVLIGTTADSGYKLNIAGNVFFGGTLGTTSTLSVKGTTAFDSLARLNIINGSADYGRAQLRITGRLQNGNDAWSMNGRNNIIFAVNANESNVGIGEDGVDKMSIQYNMVTNQLGIVSESSPNSPIASISQNGDATFNGAVAGSRFYAGYDSGVANSISCSAWFRSNGTTGWLNATYGGGINMTDTTYVRVYNNKAFWVDNNIVATGEITAFGASDIRLKSNIKQIDSALYFLSKVKTYEFDWNEKAIALNPLKTKKGAGVIAQEMSLLDNNFVHSIYGDYLGVDYERFIPYLIGGVNEVADEVTILKKRVAELELEVKQLIA